MATSLSRVTELNTTKALPPLTQSAYELMACPASYVAQEIRGIRQPESLQSDRGTEIHRVMGDYADYCVHKKVPADWAYFDRLTAAAGTEAGRILDGIRSSYEVDFEHIIGTEMTLCLTEDFEPLPISKHRDNYHASAAYKGTLDVAIVLTETKAVIEDFKSHPRPFDPDTFQSMLYPFLLFIHMPSLEEIEFRLRFVRYAKAMRSVVWKRSDMPEMLATVERARKRQLALHKPVLLVDSELVELEKMALDPGSMTPIRAIDPGISFHVVDSQAPAIPCKQCLYCPLLNNGCPVPEEVNPYENVNLEDRMRLAVYLDHARKQNNDILKEYVDREGKGIEYRTGNGDLYVFGARATESLSFPAIATLGEIKDYVQQHPEDAAWVDNLLISSTKLNGYLKAKKRFDLDASIRDHAAVTTTKVKTELHRPVGDESEPEDYFAD